MASNDPLGPLLLLANAPSPADRIIDRLFVMTYQTRIDGADDNMVEQIASKLNIKISETRKLMSSILYVISQSIYNNYSTPQQIASLFDTKKFTNTTLLEIICKIISEHFDSWKEQALNSQISLPKLIDVKWRVDIKTASHVISKISAPSVIVQMKVQEPCEQKGVMGNVSTINFELSKEQLDTMLQGLGKIRDQLASIK